jgi:hypothetical protein
MQIREIFKKQIPRGRVLIIYLSCAPLQFRPSSFPPSGPPLLLLLLLPLLGFAMSGYDQLPPGAGIPPQSITNVLSPGIISLSIQGLETGLVLSQFAQWLSLERKEGITITVLVLFVTTVGLSAHFLPFVFFFTWTLGAYSRDRLAIT